MTGSELVAIDQHQQQQQQEMGENEEILTPQKEPLGPKPAQLQMKQAKADQIFLRQQKDNNHKNGEDVARSKVSQKECGEPYPLPIDERLQKMAGAWRYVHSKVHCPWCSKNGQSVKAKQAEGQQEEEEQDDSDSDTEAQNKETLFDD